MFGCDSVCVWLSSSYCSHIYVEMCLIPQRQKRAATVDWYMNGISVQDSFLLQHTSDSSAIFQAPSSCLWKPQDGLWGLNTLRSGDPSVLLVQWSQPPQEQSTQCIAKLCSQMEPTEALLLHKLRIWPIALSLNDWIFRVEFTCENQSFHSGMDNDPQRNTNEERDLYTLANMGNKTTKSSFYSI